MTELTELQDAPDEPMQPKGLGKGVKYKVGEEECEMVCLPLTDGGTYWEFKRSGKVYPLRLSDEGTQALVLLWHACFFANTDVTLKSPPQKVEA